MNTLYVKDRNRWRAWLEKNGRTCEEIWLLYYKKASGKPRIAYEDALDEALCFGWIDSKIRRTDDLRYAQKFTPRKAKSRWSATNVTRARKLIKEGRMTAAGLAAFQSHKARAIAPPPEELPRELAGKFKRQSGAWENFNRFPPFYRRMTIRWVAGAKREETRHKRLDQLIASAADNRRIKFM